MVCAPTQTIAFAKGSLVSPYWELRAKKWWQSQTCRSQPDFAGKAMLMHLGLGQRAHLVLNQKSARNLTTTSVNNSLQHASALRKGKHWTPFFVASHCASHLYCDSPSIATVVLLMRKYRCVVVGSGFWILVPCSPWCSRVTARASLLAVELSLNCPCRCSDAVSLASPKSIHCKQKLPIASKKAPESNCKQRSWIVSKKLPSVSEAATSKVFLANSWCSSLHSVHALWFWGLNMRLKVPRMSAWIIGEPQKWGAPSAGSIHQVMRSSSADKCLAKC